MTITQSLVVFCFLILSLFQTLSGANSDCSSSSCGIIPNITSPFRLSHDPPHCGDPKYELVCENNVTFVYLKSQKYHVKQINYHNFTIRLADVTMNSSTCSIPLSSQLIDYSDTLFKPYSLNAYVYGSDHFITFMRCPDLSNTSSVLIRHPDCLTAPLARDRHTYMMVGQHMEGRVQVMCTVDFVVPTSWNFGNSNNATLSEIHQSLLYGFEVSWFSFLCRNCRGGKDCSMKPDGRIACKPHNLYYKWRNFKDSFRPPKGPLLGYLMIFLLLLAVLFVGVSLPAKIVVGAVFGYMMIMKDWRLEQIEKTLVVSFGLRFMVGILLAMWFLMYTFRRRHLSMYEEIEDYLQTDDKLMPIRYSYSDLKKITRGFREKLGEGGFGSVYKGKLRSGHYVAVKLLRKPRENSQDFMNEIATIGRIHHVNVVKLVGYCADRSKRALVFDFMSNGSLDKYIFSPEETNCLDWGTKFKIITGVARGIEYLHCGCDIQILHFDIKPHNIILDDKFVAKISDFGLAKLCSIEKDTVTLTAARGTIGYVAPELLNRSIGKVSHKADVYSFGMLLIEMLGLNRDFKGKNDDSSKYFPYWIYDHINEGRAIDIGKTEENINSNDENDNVRRLVRRMTIVALWCIKMSPYDRPSMSKVLEMLESESECLWVPDYPSQTRHIIAKEEETWSTDDSVSFLHSNDITNPEIRIEDF